MLLTECARKVLDYGKTQSDSINHAVDEFIWVNLFWYKSINEQVTLFNRTTLNIFRKFIPNKIALQWTLSVSLTLCLEYRSISNKMFGPLKFPKRRLHSLSLFRTSLSRTFPYIEQIFRSLEPFSLSISNIYIFEIHFEFPNKIEFESKRKFRP